MSAHDHLGEQFEDYRMDHRPDPEGTRLHEAESMFPDVHEHPEYYSHDKQSDGPSLSAMRAARGNPEAVVPIYRAAPHGVDKINPGDWVTTSPAYARQHGTHPSDPSKDWPVIKGTARAKDLTTEGNSVNEWGYFPKKSR